MPQDLLRAVIDAAKKARIDITVQCIDKCCDYDEHVIDADVFIRELEKHLTQE